MATFYNQAYLNYNGRNIASNVISGELQDVLTATKTAVVGVYGPQSTVTYLVSLVNGGSLPFTNLTLTDNLGSYAGGAGTLTPLTYVANSVKLYVNGALQSAPTESPGANSIAFTGINLPANSNLLLVYAATVNQYAPLTANGTVNNTVTVTGAGVNAALTAEETITALSAPDLSISKSLNPTTVTENGDVTYTFVIRNSGNVEVTAGDAVSVTDTFTPILRSISVSLNGTPLTLGSDYTYDQDTGAFATVAGKITVPAAVFAQDTATGVWTTTPGNSVLTVTGTL